MTRWTALRLHEVADRRAVKNSAGVNRVMTVSAQRGLVDQDTYFTKRVASADLSTYLVVQPGDFVYNKSRAIGAPWGTIVRHEGSEPVVVTPLYIVFRPRPEVIDPDFLLLACNGSRFFGSLAGLLREGSRAHGLLNVRINEFFSAEVPVPALAVQRRIGDLMSAVNAHLAALEAEAAAARLHFRELVRELTRPTDTAVPLTSVTEILDNRRIPVSARERQARSGDVPYYGAAGLAGWIDEPLFDEPLVLLGEDGAGLLEWDRRPIAYRVDGPCWVNNHAHVLRATGVSTDWLMFSLMHYDISDLINAGTRPKLNKGMLQSILVNLPQDDRSEKVLRAAMDAERAITREVADSSALRTVLLGALLEGDLEIPESFDRQAESA